jgi:serine/threonine protein kinase
MDIRRYGWNPSHIANRFGRIWRSSQSNTDNHNSLTVDVRRSDAKGKYLPSPVDLQIFARKILRLFGGVRKEDIDNEARAVSELCAAGRCRNVVEVIRHNWLPTDSSYYYIDMEYCLETLDDRIQGRSRGPKLALEPAEVLNAASDVNSQMTEFVENMETMLKSDFSEFDMPESDMQAWLDVIDDIVNALIYIHNLGTVHRDLKPQNGKHYIFTMF